MKKFIGILLLFCFNIQSKAQPESTGGDVIPVDTVEGVEVFPDYIQIDGRVYPVLITPDDTLILASLDDISISSPRTFSNAKDYMKYVRYKAYAAKVYPYAKKAIQIFREQEYATNNMSKRKRKRFIKKLQKELEDEFEKPLKSLSKTQGKILVRMIERELDTPLYYLILKLNGKFKAFYWNQFSKLFGYRLKHGYIEGENPILDAVLQDLDISYEIPNEISKSY